MSEPLRHPQSNDDEPVPQFATAADFALADALRRAIELRYFGTGGGSPPAPAAANEDGAR
jgi:hypothetical protein